MDLLFYHLKLRCYVVIGPKACDFEPGFISRLNMYQNAVNDMKKQMVSALPEELKSSLPSIEEKKSEGGFLFKKDEIIIRSSAAEYLTYVASVGNQQDRY